MHLSTNRLGQKLRELRGNRSLYEVGKATGIDRSHIKKYEDGLIPPTLSKLEKLGDYFEAYEELMFLFLEQSFPGQREKQAIIQWAETLKNQ